jgi:membrane protein required for colicin V production
MTLLDYFVLIVVVLSVASGAAKGVLKGAISIVSVIAGLFAAVYLYSWVAAPISLLVSERLSELLGFGVVFVGVVIGGMLLVRCIRGVLRRIRLGWADHAVGAIFGLLRAWMICSVIYLALTAFPVRLSAIENAAFAPILLEGTKVIAYATSPEMRDRFTNGYEAVTRLWQKKE